MSRLQAKQRLDQLEAQSKIKTLSKSDLLKAMHLILALQA